MYERQLWVGVRLRQVEERKNKSRRGKELVSDDSERDNIKIYDI